MTHGVLCAAGLGYCTINYQHQFLSVDDATVQILGHDRDFLMAHTLCDMLSSHVQTLPQLTRPEPIAPLRVSIVTADGMSRTLLVTRLAYDDKQIELLLQDVSGVIQQRDTILQSFSDAVLILNRDQEILEIYPNETLNIDLSQVIGRCVTDNVLEPADLAQEIYKYAQYALASGDLQAFQFHSFEDNNATRFFELRIRALSDREVLVIIREITAFKREEELLGGAVEGLDALQKMDEELAVKLEIERVMQLGLGGMMRLSHVPNGFVALLDSGELTLRHHVGHYDTTDLNTYLKRQDTLITEAIRLRHSLLFKGDELKNHPLYEPLLNETDGVFIEPLIHQDDLMGVVYLETSDAQNFTASVSQTLSVMVGRIAIALENAQLVAQNERELQEKQRLYEEVSRLEQIKTDMIRIASHDLRNTLAAIMGYLEMLKWDIDQFDTVHQGYIANVDDAARRMQKMTHDILSLERIEEVALHGSEARFDLNQLIKQVYQDHLPSATLAGLTYELDALDEPIIVEGDDAQLHEAVANLVSNAIKYTPRNGMVKLKLDTAEKMARVPLSTLFPCPNKRNEHD
jgi:signal transduction histidine kinase